MKGLYKTNCFLLNRIFLRVSINSSNELKTENSRLSSHSIALKRKYIGKVTEKALANATM